MIHWAARDRARRVIKRGFLATIVPVFGFAIAAAVGGKARDWMLAAAFGIGALGGVVTVGWALAFRLLFNPNKGRHLLMPPDEEIASSAMTLAEFDELVAEPEVEDDSGLSHPVNS
jgi:hypothetical protein